MYTSFPSRLVSLFFCFPTSDIKLPTTPVNTTVCEWNTSTIFSLCSAVSWSSWAHDDLPLSLYKREWIIKGKWLTQGIPSRANSVSFVQRIRVRQEDNKYTKEWTDCILPWNGTAADVIPVNGGQKTMRTTSCGRYTQNQTNGSLYRRKGHSSRPSNRLTMTRPAPVDYIQADKRFVLFGYLGSQCSTKSNNPIAIVFLFGLILARIQ